MSKINDLLIARAEKYISALFAEKLPVNIIYHNFDHVMRVKGYAETIGKNTGLGEEEMNILLISALFHETGYVNSYEKCNEESVTIATAFLKEAGVEPTVIDRISDIIRSGLVPRDTMDNIAEVLCDADMMYIASENGIEQFDLLYDESVMGQLKFEKRRDFETRYIELYNTHAYFTEYGKKVLQPRKEVAVKRILERRERRKMMGNTKDTSGKNKVTYSRGVETMFRITARNQINLNSIADNKSNILISVNAIIISIIITMLAGNIGRMSQDILPILVLLVICLTTIIIAILSTRPNIVTQKFTGEDLKKKNVDLIFFGNFIKMDFDEYLDAMKELMTDEEHLYSTLTKNQYSLGKILSKKFRLVRIAYNVFMFGIILAVVVFLLNFYFTRTPV